MINTQWCSFCAGKPAIGEAVVDDGTGLLMEIGLCADCYRKVAGPVREGDYSIAWDDTGC